MGMEMLEFLMIKPRNLLNTGSSQEILYSHDAETLEELELLQKRMLVGYVEQVV